MLLPCVARCAAARGPIAVGSRVGCCTCHLLPSIGACCLLLLPCCPVLLLCTPRLLRPGSGVLACRCRGCYCSSRCRHVPLATAACWLLLHHPMLPALLRLLQLRLVLLLLCPGSMLKGGLLLGMNPGHLLLLLWRRAVPKRVRLLRMLLLPPAS